MLSDQHLLSFSEEEKQSTSGLSHMGLNVLMIPGCVDMSLPGQLQYPEACAVKLPELCLEPRSLFPLLLPCSEGTEHATRAG